LVVSWPRRYIGNQGDILLSQVGVILIPFDAILNALGSLVDDIPSLGNIVNKYL
jgi:hypothetical protein